MTIICYDGNIMAADKLSMGPTMNLITKIHKVNGEMIGISGRAVMVAPILEWAAGGFQPELMPAEQKDVEKWLHIMVVGKDRRVRIYENTAIPWYNERGIHALGSACELGLGAMMGGAPADIAVRVACMAGMACGGGINTINLDNDIVTLEQV